MNKTKRVAILGAGSWGTAVALHIAQSGHEILLWSHDPAQVREMREKKENPDYLPGVAFPDLIKPTADINEALGLAQDIIVAVPSHAFAEVLAQITKPINGLAWLTKGLDPQTHQLLSELVYARYGGNFPIGVISGPSFAKEVAHHLPTALTLAGNNTQWQIHLHALLHHHALRVYLSEDLTGVQICGAVKNVLAIACGISDGLGYGANARAALITRGLAEMTRLGIAMGAKSETFIGLAGLGDLVLTCTDNQSRNRRFGLLTGEGKTADEAQVLIGQVVEGRHNAAQVCALAQQHQVEMPICEQVLSLLNGEINPHQAVGNLMNRPPKEE